MKFEELKIILKRLYKEYIKKHLKRILIALILSLIVAASTSGIAMDNGNEYSSSAGI